MVIIYLWASRKWRRKNSWEVRAVNIYTYTYNACHRRLQNKELRNRHDTRFVRGGRWKRKGIRKIRKNTKEDGIRKKKKKKVPANREGVGSWNSRRGPLVSLTSTLLLRYRHQTLQQQLYSIMDSLSSALPSFSYSWVYILKPRLLEHCAFLVRLSFAVWLANLQDSIGLLPPGNQI